VEAAHLKVAIPVGELTAFVNRPALRAERYVAPPAEEVLVEVRRVEFVAACLAPHIPAPYNTYETAK